MKVVILSLVYYIKVIINNTYYEKNKYYPTPDISCKQHASTAY